MITKKEKEAIKIIINEIEEKLVRHNKNLTNKQYYAAEDAVACLRYIIDRDGKKLFSYKGARK